MAHLVDHAADLRRITVLHGLPDAVQPQRAKRLQLALIGAVLRPALGDDELAHVDASAAAGCGSASAEASGSPPRPKTWLIDRPRSSATSSGVRSDSSPAIVAFTRLMGFCEPRLLERMSWMPASSSTARTPPPAITPVPGEAGFSSTRPDPNTPVTWWVIVEPCLGTRYRFFLARSTPFWIATGTSLAFPYPMPTTSRSSPTTTSAVKEKRRPPLTTFATRLISTTRSWRSRPVAETVRSRAISD